MLDDTLADDRLRNSSDAHVIRMRGDFHFQFHTHFAIWMDAGRKVNIHAHILIRELRIHQRIDAARRSSSDSNSGRKTAGRNGYAIANFQFSRLAVRSEE